MTREVLRWGNVWVECLAVVAGRGRVLRIAATDQEQELQVFVSNGGRSIRVWKDGKEMKVQQSER